MPPENGEEPPVADATVPVAVAPLGGVAPAGKLGAVGVALGKFGIAGGAGVVPEALYNATEPVGAAPAAPVGRTGAKTSGVVFRTGPGPVDSATVVWGFPGKAFDGVKSGGCEPAATGVEAATALGDGRTLGLPVRAEAVNGRTTLVDAA